MRNAARKYAPPVNLSSTPPESRRDSGEAHTRGEKKLPIDFLQVRHFHANSGSHENANFFVDWPPNTNRMKGSKFFIIYLNSTWPLNEIYFTKCRIASQSHCIMQIEELHVKDLCLERGEKFCGIKSACQSALIQPFLLELLLLLLLRGGELLTARQKRHN